MSKLLHSFLFILLLVVLSACATPTATSEKEVFTVNIAYGNQPGEPVDQVARKWKELAEERSDGRLDFHIYPSSQLGSEADVVEQALFGSNVIIFTGYDFLMNFVQDLGVLTAPYIVDDVDDLFYLAETEWFEEQRKELMDIGFDIVSTNTLYGERHLMTTREVLTPDDLRGMKIRVPNNQMYINTFSVLGASPTPLPLGDMYASLQQGVIDGAENPIPVLEASKTNEVAKYLALTGHTKIMSPWVSGTDFLDELPDDLLEILRETGDEAGEYGKNIVYEQEEDVLELFEEQGIIINEVDQDAFKEKAERIFEVTPEWSPDLQQTIEELLENRSTTQ
ncbi:C4-dicarboxylate TRAP transporter substrate-binding protein [Alkalicoccobacillus murimartini]|uniref:Tripartite ATP-independent transporter DctP family solute receptor n=1 Tax=Alkalicoccobacillus murimartini TaxID=171685 RepID=A0ABT9YHL5_9BACI|nr:C4-dicarboxylate TRAP transporter substrate-binding protein [Alkalicoccobacillus murimartini]MDQ0207189.1 tripartite ATP-independent transporter DctP family solute receptor [Alkalicoccobacillus murimartini]